MKSQALTKYFPHIALTEIGLILFFVFFIAMIFFVFRKSRATHYESISRLPLEEEGCSLNSKMKPLNSKESKVEL